VRAIYRRKPLRAMGVARAVAAQVQESCLAEGDLLTLAAALHPHS
jgi:hypothetical protein